ncbi:MAG: tyrosine-type recombinase/integrase [Planctomycetia bacterium]|nr:tyrosine-type recombinase/integrase [Planctomycetia bacterium]
MLVKYILPDQIIRDRLRDDFNWSPDSGVSAEYHLLRRLERSGLIKSIAIAGKQRIYQLTEKGYSYWKETFDYYKYAYAYWEESRNIHRNSLELAKDESVRIRPIIKKRALTTEEFGKLLEKSAPHYRTLIEFAFVAKVRVYDLINARIEAINTEKGYLRLEDEAVTGRKIKNRKVILSEKSKKILDEAIAGRTKGLIFLNSRGTEWTITYVSSEFRKLRKRLGFPKGVSIGGRSAKAQAAAQEMAQAVAKAAMQGE